MECLHSWHSHYVSEIWQPRDRWEIVKPDSIQAELLPLQPRRCPRILLALRQRAERLHQELMQIIRDELETGYTMQSYYGWIQDACEIMESGPDWWRYESHADILRSRLRKASYESFEHEYKITSLIIERMHACGRAWRAVSILEPEILERLRKKNPAALGEQEPGTPSAAERSAETLAV